MGTVPPATPLLEATPEHCRHCFDVLLAYYRGEAVQPPGFPQAHCAVFVTWKKADGGVAFAWGIGTLEPRDAQGAVKDYALISALKDHRFSPIHKSEIPSLQCTVSLIFGFKKMASCMEWEIGVHGLIIKFYDAHSGRSRNATFLPEVPAQEGWTKQQTIDSLIRKSGYGGQVTPQLLAAIELTTYMSSPFSMSYDQYCKYIGQPVAGFA
eukprot:CAMPEP_0177751754 /NCGR_PEP_ID=MMETSP0491_2-20121128/546_1 /TAXON_ID=63592 /ORGANISM="Tetraselmis chuii, Strain PLY429" /LENGTH=209 /DNA_ID=CAMNT_0019266895 /DNA_START=80 /DNA_END=710 /DNA_ORIENTATION=+